MIGLLGSIAAPPGRSRTRGSYRWLCAPRVSSLSLESAIPPLQRAPLGVCRRATYAQSAMVLAAARLIIFMKMKSQSSC